ncbi:hypothetical protein tinsulaeT_26530 [Thalassotalea insulae]|uniref:MobA-like NTP transferase domain-containing protein n=1 Tax=Thalassotalea insulae TaxID=2056778 RepID=A0ABQ6GTP4_9GAMM|nr:nucleotidyltransferase family protein [Thalassotalea insulae]GLX79313.1 hypothetical protein tinsulaeT_26530 [Thalassotalea insulae]
MPLVLEVILLAAGCSDRLGQPKQLVEFQGQSLIIRQSKMALALSDKVICVLGFQAKRMAQEVSQLSVRCVNNENWHSGLASSIAAGVSAVAPETDAVLLLLVDQWQLTLDDLQRLVTRWQVEPESIVCAEHSTQDSGLAKVFGPPVIFPKQYFSALTRLPQGQGAKSVIAANRQQVIWLPLASAFVDLDTPEQLSELQRVDNID